MECPISGEPCTKTCAWRIDNECAITKLSYSLMLIANNTRKDQLKKFSKKL